MEVTRRPAPVRAALIPASFLICCFSLLGYAKWEISSARDFAAEVAQVQVVAPEGRPPVTQDSIDLALVLYGITIPDSAEHPVLDKKLMDRGLTTRATFLERAIVAVGPSAFSTWGLLGSTLAHEIEVHCQQNFLGIYFMDLVGMDGTSAAERQAYLHELQGARRFGLESVDAAQIADTMEYFYPEAASSDPRTMPRAFRNWLARNVLPGPQGL